MKQVVVGLSGGVDSAAAALLLQEAGYEVLGVMLRLEAGEAANSCCNTAAQARAAEVARRLGIPFVVVDAEEAFRRAVIEPYLLDHARGRTPNPCARCNPFVKFEELLRLAERVGAERIATGHYVRREGTRVLRGLDARKDQSYFLWAVPGEVFQRSLFPLGALKKPEVRRLAEEAGLAVAKAPESQNLCFVQNDPAGFLRAHLDARPGPVVDVETGEVVGQHRGAALYTVGQKRGLGLFKSHLERYVVRVDVERNVVYVGPREAATWWGLKAGAPNYLKDPADLPERVLAQVRHRARPVPARVVEADEKGFELRFEEPVFAVTPGQSAVLYREDELLGGGVIERALESLRETPAASAAG